MKWEVCSIVASHLQATALDTHSNLILSFCCSLHRVSHVLSMFMRIFCTFSGFLSPSKACRGRLVTLNSPKVWMCVKACACWPLMACHLVQDEFSRLVLVLLGKAPGHSFTMNGLMNDIPIIMLNYKLIAWFYFKVSIYWVFVCTRIVTRIWQPM